MKDFCNNEIRQFHMLKSKDGKEWMAFMDNDGWSYKDISNRRLDGIVYFITPLEVKMNELIIIGFIKNRKSILKKCSYIINKPSLERKE